MKTNIKKKPNKLSTMVYIRMPNRLLRDIKKTADANRRSVSSEIVHRLEVTNG